MDLSCSITYKCLLCNHLAFRLDDISYHFRDCHRIDNIIDNYIEIYTYTPNVHACSRCFHIFPFLENLEQHILSNHCKHPLECQYCDYRYKNLSAKFRKKHLCAKK